ncbi:unnamed protein product, partial [Laminaria digitata]
VYGDGIDRFYEGGGGADDGARLFRTAVHGSRTHGRGGHGACARARTWDHAARVQDGDPLELKERICVRGRRALQARASAWRRAPDNGGRTPPFPVR